MIDSTEGYYEEENAYFQAITMPSTHATSRVPDVHSVSLAECTVQGSNCKSHMNLGLITHSLWQYIRVTVARQTTRQSEEDIT